ncbi:MAG: DNA repair protein [Clostridiales bacterium]|nr:DNA repair protein [Clostridiales bacterium]
MTDKELKRLNRGELLEMLIIQMEENEELKKKLVEAETALANRRIEISESGTLAEAALRLNGVFEAADQAAAQYLENIRSRAEEGTSVHEQFGS